MAEGRIIKALSGFYYVLADDRMIYQCRGRGVFRNKKVTPLVGDFVVFEAANQTEGYVTEIKQRKNELVRPPIANVDQAIIVSSAIQPDFSTMLLDRFLVLIESKDVDPIIFITKMDAVTHIEKLKMETFCDEYESLGYSVELLSSKTPLTGMEHYFNGKVSVVAGQSGVGKSSLLNALEPALLLETAAISTSLGRGKHTTRHVELIDTNGGLIADTPGFSSLDFGEISPEDLGSCFPEIKKHKDNCKFRGCMHHKEPKCAVKKAVEEGEITPYRYDHYLTFYQEILSRKPRY